MIKEQDKFLYTVSEYAALIGKTAQAVYKQVNKNQVEFINKVVDGRKQVFIVRSAELQQSEVDKQVNQKEEEVEQPVQPKDSQFLNYLIEENKRLSERNTELENKVVSLAEELSQIAKNAQLITSQAQTLHLTEKTQTTEESETEIKAERETKKKNFFSRLFKH